MKVSFWFSLRFESGNQELVFFFPQMVGGPNKEGSRPKPKKTVKETPPV